MGFVGSALEMSHAVDTGEGGASTLVTMGVEFLLGENIAAALESGRVVVSFVVLSVGRIGVVEVRNVYLALERDHDGPLGRLRLRKVNRHRLLV